MIPFVRVGDRVRYIGESRSRYGDWPAGEWLEKGKEGVIIEFHSEAPTVIIGGRRFERIEPWAVVQWGRGGKTALDADSKGKRWELLENYGNDPR